MSSLLSPHTEEGRQLSGRPPTEAQCCVVSRQTLESPGRLTALTGMGRAAHCGWQHFLGEVHSKESGSWAGAALISELLCFLITDVPQAAALSSCYLGSPTTMDWNLEL